MITTWAIPHNCDGVGAKHLGVGYTQLFGQISQGTEFVPKMQQKSVFGDFWLPKFDLIWFFGKIDRFYNKVQQVANISLYD